MLPRTPSGPHPSATRAQFFQPFERAQAALDVGTVHGVPLNPVCQEELCDPGRNVSINPNQNSILTLQRTVTDVRLECTSARHPQEAAILRSGRVFPFRGGNRKNIVKLRKAVVSLRQIAVVVGCHYSLLL